MKTLKKLTIQHYRLTKLWCSKTSLQELDLTAAPAIKELICSHNKIKVLNLKYSPLIEKINCYYNELTNIELQKELFKEHLRKTFLALSNQAKSFSCTKCPAEYTTEKSLENHVCIQCDICKEYFLKFTSLTKHYSEVHGKRFEVKAEDFFIHNYQFCKKKKKISD